MDFPKHILSHNKGPVADYIASIILRNGYKTAAIAGASGSGKTTLALALLRQLTRERALIMGVDDYWKYNRETLKHLGLTGYDWEARDRHAFLKHIEQLKRGEAIQKPIFDDWNELSTGETELVEPRELIIMEGTLDFIGMADICIFMYAPEEVLIERRITRDSEKTAIHGRDALSQYLQERSLPAYRNKLLPLIHNAHFIVDTASGLLYERAVPQ